MSNIYSFFGLPDPTDEGRLDVGEDESEAQVEAVQVSSIQVLAEQKFHDLGEARWQEWNRRRMAVPRRSIRYVTPDELHRMPTYGISQRLISGDIVVIDLRDLKHMKSQQDACRRELGGMAERLGAPVFSLDEEDTLLLLPGAGSIVDTTSHHLGVHEE
jgi:hypothetical protein